MSSSPGLDGGMEGLMDTSELFQDADLEEGVAAARRGGGGDDGGTSATVAAGPTAAAASGPAKQQASDLLQVGADTKLP